MVLKTKNLIKMTKEYVLPLLDQLGIEIDVYGFMRPAGIEGENVYSIKGKNFICPVTEVAIQHYFENYDKSILFNPFSDNKSSDDILNYMLKFTERLIYCNEIGDYYDDGYGNSYDKSEDQIRDEIREHVSLIRTVVDEKTKLSKYKFDVNKIGDLTLDGRKLWTLIGEVVIITDKKKHQLLLIGEVLKYYDPSIYDYDINTYKTGIDEKLYYLNDGIQKVIKDIDKNFEIVKLMKKKDDVDSIVHSKDLLKKEIAYSLDLDDTDEEEIEDFYQQNKNLQDFRNNYQTVLSLDD